MAPKFGPKDSLRFYTFLQAKFLQKEFPDVDIDAAISGAIRSGYTGI